MRNVTIRRLLVVASRPRERRWFESVDFGASALEEEEDYRSVAKAKSLRKRKSTSSHTRSTGSTRESIHSVVVKEAPEACLGLAGCTLPHGNT